MQKNIFKEMLKADQTVFSFKELLIKFPNIDLKILKSKLNYYVRNGDLYAIRRGLYAKNADYNRFEVATKIFIPSYISYETVLISAGVIFQYYSQIFVASYQSREIECDRQVYVFRTIKSVILTNPSGIEIRKNYSIASIERAFLDIVYRTKKYHFDNLEPINWKRVFEILPIYGDNKSMIKRVNKYFESFRESIDNA